MRGGGGGTCNSGASPRPRIVEEKKRGLREGGATAREKNLQNYEKAFVQRTDDQGRKGLVGGLWKTARASAYHSSEKKKKNRHA